MRLFAALFSCPYLPFSFVTPPLFSPESISLSMQHLGVSIGAGVLPSPTNNKKNAKGKLTIIQSFGRRPLPAVQVFNFCVFGATPRERQTLSRAEQE